MFTLKLRNSGVRQAAYDLTFHQNPPCFVEGAPVTFGPLSIVCKAAALFQVSQWQVTSASLCWVGGARQEATALFTWRNTWVTSNATLEKDEDKAPCTPSLKCNISDNYRIWWKTGIHAHSFICKYKLRTHCRGLPTELFSNTPYLTLQSTLMRVNRNLLSFDKTFNLCRLILLINS